MASRVVSVVLVAVLVAACGDDLPTIAADVGSAGDEERTGVEGVWAVVEVDGQPAEVGVNMAGAAYVDIGAGEITGHLGCNDGGGVITIDETTILIDEFFRTASGCIPDDRMIVEEALWAAMVADPVTYAIPTSSQMIWRAGGHEVVFERVSSVPTTTRTEAPRRHAVMGLDCGDGWVEEISQLPNVGQTPMEVAVEYAPEVVDLDEIGPLQHTGRDQSGNVVILVFLHDTAEMDFQVWYCVDE